MDEGWGWPRPAKKAHFFRGSMSLCRRWMFTGPLEDANGPASKDDCAECTRLREKATA